MLIRRTRRDRIPCFILVAGIFYVLYVLLWPVFDCVEEESMKQCFEKTVVMAYYNNSNIFNNKTFRSNKYLRVNRGRRCVVTLEDLSMCFVLFKLKFLFTQKWFKRSHSEASSMHLQKQSSGSFLWKRCS